MIRQHDQLPGLVAADMLGNNLALVQDMAASVPSP